MNKTDVLEKALYLIGTELVYLATPLNALLSSMGYVITPIDDKEEKESVNQDGAKCENCNYTLAQVAHTCPYKEDICGDYETICNCCDYCKIACGEYLILSDSF